MQNKSVSAIFISLLSVLLLSGCTTIGDKTTSMSMIYLATTILSFILIIGYFICIKKKEPWFVVLFISVFIVNMGYFWLSVSPTLAEALWANRVSYLGSVFLPLSMFMAILHVSKLKYKKWVPHLLLGISVIVFLIAASPGYLNIYYQSVTLETVNGISVLNKEYGPWHSVYLFYLIGYFAVMITSVIQAIIKKKIDSTAHAVIILASVFVNICVWLVGQLVKTDFEFLSISYIITELFLITVYLMIQHQDRLIASLEAQLSTPNEPTQTLEINSLDMEHIQYFSEKIPTLTASEKAIFDCYVAGMSTKEVLAEKGISENTLKYHNKNLYGKLGVSSRKELLEYAKASKKTQM
ncbi:MAG: hypothetical protein IKW04_02735 [Clostridia bacterium]|nr:hypothetical protein [Clostridia bacterium]